MDLITYRKKTRTGWFLGLLLAAVLLRAAVDPGLLRRAGEGLAAFLRGDRLFRAVLYLETGGSVRSAVPPADPPSASGPAPEEKRQPGADPLEYADPEPTAEPEGPSDEPGPAQTEPDLQSPSDSAEPPFTAAEAEAIVLRGNCGYEADKAGLLLAPLDWTEEPGPKILILHTHSSEAYTPTPDHPYAPDGDYRSLEPSSSVIAVGDALTEALGALGVEVLHDRTCCDYPSYNRSYAVARSKIQSWLEEYPSIRMVIDLHRDAMDPPVRETAEVGGKEAAALMLVVGTDEGGLSHPHWQDNLSCALKLQALANRSFPGLFKSVSFRRERFNEDLTPGSLIVEVGSTGNTLEEACAAMPALAALLSGLLSAAFGN